MNIQRPKPLQAWPEDKARKIYNGKVFEVFEWDEEQFDGSKKTFEAVRRKDCVGIIPIMPDGKIMMTHEEQPGMEPFISVPGGAIDDGEDIIEATKRELIEETGYTADKLTLWYGRQFVYRLDRAYYTFIGKGIRKVQEITPEAGEKIKLKFVTFDEFIKIVSQRNYRDFDIALETFRAMSDPKEFEKMKKLFSA